MAVDLSPAAARRALSVDEVDEVVAADVRTLFADDERARVFVSRLAATLQAHRERYRQLTADIARITHSRRGSEDPVRRAVDALSRLDEEQSGQVFSIAAGQLVAALRDQVAQARAARVAADSARVRAELVLLEAADTPDMPAEVAEMLRGRAAELKAARSKAGVAVDGEFEVPHIDEPFDVPEPASGALADLFA